jgi:hypothetical protein
MARGGKGMKMWDLVLRVIVVILITIAFCFGISTCTKWISKQWMHKAEAAEIIDYNKIYFKGISTLVPGDIPLDFTSWEYTWNIWCIDKKFAFMEFIFEKGEEKILIGIAHEPLKVTKDFEGFYIVDMVVWATPYNRFFIDKSYWEGKDASGKLEEVKDVPDTFDLIKRKTQ